MSFSYKRIISFFVLRFSLLSFLILSLCCFIPKAALRVFFFQYFLVYVYNLYSYQLKDLNYIIFRFKPINIFFCSRDITLFSSVNYKIANVKLDIPYLDRPLTIYKPDRELRYLFL